MSLMRPLMLSAAACLMLASAALAQDAQEAPEASAVADVSEAQNGLPPVPQLRPDYDASVAAQAPQFGTTLDDLGREAAAAGEPLFGSFIGMVRVLGAESSIRLVGDISTAVDGDVVTRITADDPNAFSLAVLRTLDKITARMSTQEVLIGETIALGNLRVTPRKCLKNPPTETPESSAFLDIYELPKDSDPEAVFQGWMFASSPALNAMEHAVFDVWLLDCKN